MKRKIITILFIIYIVFLLRITVFRANMFHRRLFSGTVNATLFREYIPLIRNGAWRRSIYLFVGNIACFIPIGMYLQWAKRWKVGITVLTGFLFSLLIETMQYILGTGVSELNDLILNSVGAVIGAFVIKFLYLKFER